jgi:hypothetical protein
MSLTNFPLGGFFAEPSFARADAPALSTSHFLSAVGAAEE